MRLYFINNSNLSEFSILINKKIDFNIFKICYRFIIKIIIIFIYLTKILSTVGWNIRLQRNINIENEILLPFSANHLSLYFFLSFKLIYSFK